MIGNLPLPQSPSLCTDPPIPPVKIYSLLRFLLRGGGGTVPRLLSPAKRLFATNTLKNVETVQTEKIWLSYLEFGEFL